MNSNESPILDGDLFTITLAFVISAARACSALTVNADARPGAPLRRRLDARNHTAANLARHPPVGAHNFPVEECRSEVRVSRALLSTAD